MSAGWDLKSCLRTQYACECEEQQIGELLAAGRCGLKVNIHVPLKQPVEGRLVVELDRLEYPMKMLRSIFIAFAAGCITAMPPMASAQTGGYPTRPIRLVAPFPPGGQADIVARLVAQKLGEAWKQAVIVENRPGGNAMIGAEAVAKSPPDGYTFLLTGTVYAANVSLFPKSASMLQKELQSVAIAGLSSTILVVRPDSPIRTLQELVVVSKTKSVSGGSSGNGAASHLGLELFKSKTGANILHVPNKGTSPALADLLGGQIDVFFALMAVGAPYVQSGRLRALAVTSEKRQPQLPDVPTTLEAGIAGVSFATWVGLMVPSGTPRSITTALNSEMNRIAASPETKSRMLELGFQPAAMSESESEKFFNVDVDRWAKVIREANIKAD